MEKYIMFPLSCCSVNIKRVCICLNKKVYFCSTSWSVHNPEGEERQGEKERQEREEERRGGEVRWGRDRGGPWFSGRP